MTQKNNSKGEFCSETFLNRLPIKKDDKFIDLGCGRGYFSQLVYEKYGSDILIYAIDKNRDMIENLKNKLPINLISGDLNTRTALESDFFTIGLMINVFHGLFYRGEIENVFGEIKRILALPSQLIIIDYKEEAMVKQPSLSIRNNPDKIQKLIRTHGFELEEHLTLNTDYFMAIFSLGP